MDRKDFKPCAGCGRGVMHTGLPLFWKVRIERWGVNARQVQQRHGMETFFGGGPGGVALADVFSSGAIAEVLPGTEVDVLVCEACSTKPKILAALADSEYQKRKDGPDAPD